MLYSSQISQYNIQKKGGRGVFFSSPYLIVDAIKVKQIYLKVSELFNKVQNVV